MPGSASARGHEDTDRQMLLEIHEVIVGSTDGTKPGIHQKFAAITAEQERQQEEIEALKASNTKHSDRWWSLALGVAGAFLMHLITVLFTTFGAVAPNVTHGPKLH